MSELKVEYLPIGELLPYARNMNAHSDEHVSEIAASIKEFGWTVPALIDKASVLVAGHGRVLAARKLGIDLIPCIRRDHWTETQAKAYRILDNRVPKNADLDLGMLTLELQDLQGADFDLDLLGFGDELESLLNPEVAPGEGLTDPDAVPENVETRCKPGDLWVLGKHRLLCGDSTNVQHVERLMGGENVELCFTDPPYELETRGGGLLKESSAMKGIRDLGIDKFDPSSLVSMAPTSVFCCNKPLVPAYISLAKAWGVAWDLCVYHKQNVTPNYGGHLMTDLEYLLVIGKQAPITGQEKDLYSKLYSGGKDSDNPTAWSKPVALCEKFIRLYSVARNSVLDLFLGSGSTLIACEKTGRRCFGMEIDPHYCSVVLKRWEDFTGLAAVLEAQHG